MPNRALVARVKKGFDKIRAELPYIKELRNRFASLPRGTANIDGCKTWTEFCERRLHRTDRRIRQVLAEEEVGIIVHAEKQPPQKEIKTEAEKTTTTVFISGIEPPEPKHSTRAVIETVERLAPATRADYLSPQEVADDFMSRTLRGLNDFRKWQVDPREHQAFNALMADKLELLAKQLRIAICERLDGVR